MRQWIFNCEYDFNPDVFAGSFLVFLVFFNCSCHSFFFIFEYFMFQYIYLQLIWIRRHHLSVSVNLVFAEETRSVQHLVSTTSDEVFSIKQPVFQYYSVYPPGVCVRKPMCLFWWVERAWKSLRGVSSLRIWRSVGGGGPGEGGRHAKNIEISKNVLFASKKLAQEKQQIVP